MYNKEQAKLSPLINNKAWNNLVEYLNNLQTDVQGSGNGTIGVGATPTAGETALLEQIKKLKNDHEAVISDEI